MASNDPMIGPARWRFTRRGLVRIVGAGGVAAALGGAVAACSGDEGGTGGAGGTGSGGGGANGGGAEPVAIVTNLPDGDEPVAVDTQVQVEAQNGTLTTVSLVTPDGTVVPLRQFPTRDEADPFAERLAGATGLWLRRDDDA